MCVITCIRILHQHECEIQINKSVSQLSVWHHLATLVMPVTFGSDLFISTSHAGSDSAVGRVSPLAFGSSPVRFLGPAPFTSCQLLVKI